MADDIRGLEFVATALGGKITNESSNRSSKSNRDRRPPQTVVVIFLFVFGRRPSTWLCEAGLGFITTIAVSNFTYLYRTRTAISLDLDSIDRHRISDTAGRSSVRCCCHYPESPKRRPLTHRGPPHNFHDPPIQPPPIGKAK